MVRVLDLFSAGGFSYKPKLADRLRHGYESILLWCAYNIMRLPRADPPYPKEWEIQDTGYEEPRLYSIPGTMRFDVENYSVDTIWASPPCIGIEEE